MQSDYIALLVLWAVVLVGAGSASPSLSSNYNISAISDFALVSPPLQVPLSLPRNSDPLPHTPIHQKYNLQHHRPHTPNLNLEGLKPRMLHIDYQLLYEEEPPLSFFEDKYHEDYHLLESREFTIMLSNPSQIFTICLQEIFSDCQSIKKALKRPLPFCINPYTKYPLHFNLYVTAAKNRQLIKSAIFFNATINYGHHSLINRVWMKEVRFNLLPNHLKLYSFELRNCRQEHSVVSIKNPQKNDLALMIVYKHKKLFMNNQPFDEKVTISAGKIFRFMIEGRDATMTIYTHNPENTSKVYPILYIPLYCLDQLTIEHVPIGIISAKNLALTFPLLVTSHSSSLMQIQQVELLSSSQAIELVKSPTHKILVHPNEKFIQIGAFTVRATKNPSFKNTISLRIIFKYTNHQNSSEIGQINRNLSYTQMYDPIEVGMNRYYDVTKLKQGEYNDTQKIMHFNYSVINRMQIPIRVQRIFFNSQRFRMHWFRYSGGYIYPKRLKQQILLQYIGPRTLPLSPVKYAAAIELSGGMVIPFEVIVFDNTLTCIYQGKEDRCSKLKLISFGYQKTDQKIQTQTIMIKNHNPTNITLQMQPYVLPHKNINFSLNFSRPFPYYQDAVIVLKNRTLITLLSGYTINLTIQIKVSKTIVGDMNLVLITPFQKISPRIRFHFETGKLLFSNQTIEIPQFDLMHYGQLNLSSTYQDSYSIKEVISTTPKLQFNYNETQQFEQLESALISYTYNPYKDNNVTQQCCAEDFIKSYYLNAIINGQDTLTTSNYEVAVVTSSQMEQKTIIKVNPVRSSLLNITNKTLNLKVVKASMGAYFCLTVNNPYQKPMKYSISFLSHSVVNKPKDFFTYLKHAKRERVDTYFCIKGHGRNQNHITPTSLKLLFRLQQKPTELSLGKDGSYTDANPAQRTNLSNNDYLNTFTQTGKQICYKFTSILYIKLLIQSEVINQLIDRYPFNFTQKLIEREHQHIQDTTFTRFYDQFYTQIPLNLQRYCTAAVYPIFRFCQQIPLKNMSPAIISDPARKAKRINKQYNPSRVIASKKEEETCYMLHGHNDINKLSFQLLISNNYSKFDDYKVNMNLIQPKVLVGDIAFQQNHKINLTTFLKHYFSSLYKSIKSEEDDQIIKQNGIKHKSNIIPVYFTNQDYDDNFGIFKGERFFQLNNLSPIDIDFTHYGFENKQNTRFFSGFSIEQIGMPQNRLSLAANSKSTFRIAFNIDRNFNLNISNPFMHHHINLYLYKSNHYYIHLHLVFKVADNIIAKIKAHSEENQYQSSSSLGYIIINLVSLSFICAVISQLKKQEEEKQNKLKVAKEKLKKIEMLNSANPKKDENIDFGKDLAQQKIKKRTIILPSTSIGTKILVEPEKRNKPCYIISQQQLTYFKTLKIKEDKSIISESSESEPQFRLSQTESERPKTDEQSKSENEEIKVQRSEISSQKADKFQEEEAEGEEDEYEQEESSSLIGSEHSLTESMLPDGISVCNEQMDIDQNMDFQFGFQKEKPKIKTEKKNNEEEYVYYNVFSSHHPLKQKKQEDLFPWMIQNEKKKSQRASKRKIE